MNLADLRKLAIRKQIRIRFPLKNGMECVINERGVAQVPALQAPPDFNLEAELSEAGSFVLEAVTIPGARNAPKPTSLTRDALAAMATDGAHATQVHDDHEDE